MSDSENRRPSRYCIAVDITFHSEDVDILYRGRDRGKKSAYIPRYPVVARALKDIYTQMHADNPFAETMLIDFEARLDEVFALADTRIARCEALAAHALKQSGVTVRPFTRDHPFVYTSVVAQRQRLDDRLRQTLATGHAAGGPGSQSAGHGGGTDTSKVRQTGGAE